MVEQTELAAHTSVLFKDLGCTDHILQVNNPVGSGEGGGGWNKGKVLRVFSKSHLNSNYYNLHPWETCKQPSTMDLAMWRSNKYKYHLQVLHKMILNISFKSPTVDNLLLAKTPLITFVIIYKWRF